MRSRAFTLIELMIVVAIIAIIAAVAIPGLLRSRIGACESTTLGNLKSLSVGQQNFQNTICVDLNRDGGGEYGYLEELGGGKPCRSDNSGGTGGPRIESTPFLSMEFGKTNANGEALKSGYLCVVYLPVSASDGVKVYPGTVDISLSSQCFSAYAFPAQAGRTGVRVFAVLPSGNLFQFSNSDRTFNGSGSGPGWDALFGDNDGASGITWNDGPDLGGPGQTGAASDAWSPAGG